MQLGKYTLEWAREGTETIEAMKIVLKNDAKQTAEITIKGGLGYLPVTFTGLTAASGYAILVDGQRLNQSVQGNDFWQTDHDVATQRWQQTYNLELSAGQPHTIDFTRAISKNIK